MCACGVCVRVRCVCVRRSLCRTGLSDSERAETPNKRAHNTVPRLCCVENLLTYLQHTGYSFTYILLTSYMQLRSRAQVAGYSIQALVAARCCRWRCALAAGGWCSGRGPCTVVVGGAARLVSTVLAAAELLRSPESGVRSLESGGGERRRSEHGNRPRCTEVRARWSLETVVGGRCACGDSAA